MAKSIAPTPVVNIYSGNKYEKDEKSSHKNF